MINLVEHVDHSIALKLSEDSNNLDVLCWTCHDTRTAARIGSFILNDEENK
jgi:hypothetical protein